MNNKLPVEYIVKSASVVKKLAYVIAVVGAVASFGTQVELLQTWDISTAFSIMIPLTVDLLAICAAIALQVPDLPPVDKKRIGWIMVIALSVSITANMISGHNIGSRLAHAWPVIAYMLAEYIANRLRAYVAYVQAKQAEKIAAEAAAKRAEMDRIAEDKRREDTKQAEIDATKVEALIKKIVESNVSAKAKILQMSALDAPLTIAEIAAYTGSSAAWVRSCLKTS